MTRIRRNSDVFLDLKDVSRQERMGAWQGWVPLAFPGLKVTHIEGNVPSGVVRLIDIGRLRIWSIHSTANTVASDPDTIPIEEATVAVLVAKDGVQLITQEDRLLQLQVGDMTVLDNSRKFQIESIGVSHVLVCTLPRIFVLEQCNRLLDCCASKVSSDSAMATLLLTLLNEICESHGRYNDAERSGCVEAFSAIATRLPFQLESNASPAHWRIKKALELIDRAIDDADLDANIIAKAQNISRRRLDQLFFKELGSTVAAQILERRLMHAASALCDPLQTSRQITDIAFGAGFKDSAHFSRAFKRRFAESPSAWRAKATLDRN